MASINSIYGSSTNKGVGGLLSGLDTDDLVEKMTLGTRTKINRQYQSKQKLLYRQQAYREISSKLLAFSDKYLSFSSGSKTNIMSPSFFEAYTFNSSSEYVKIAGNPENIKNFAINSISQVASAARYTSEVSGLKKSIDSDYAIKGEISSLVGGSMSLRVGDKTYNITLDEGLDEEISIQNVVDQLNKQLAKFEGNKTHEVIKYKAVGNKIALDTDDGRTGDAVLVAVSDNIKNALKLEINTSAVSKEDISLSDLKKTTEQVFSDSSNYITFEYNGTIKRINLSDVITDGTSLKTYLQTEIDKAYGTNKIEVNFVDNKLDFKLANETDNKDNTLRISSISNEMKRMVGIKSGDGNRLNTEDTIGSMKLKKGEDTISDYSIVVNDEPIDIDASMTINDIMKAIKDKTNLNISYSVTTDKFTITTKETGENSKIKISGDLADALFGTNIDVSGQDTKMKVTINGGEPMDITRSTANFAIDGMSIELNEKAKDSVKASEPLTFEVINNSDEVVERVKKFIDEYNEIITMIGTKTKEKPSRKYPPLTPDQQEEMNDKEIEDWNKEAQKGILFGDSKMTTLLSNLRISMMGKTDVSDLVLSNIGISPAFMDTSGKLVFDEKKFKEALLEKPDEIASLFTGSTEDGKPGLAVQLREVFTKNIGMLGTSGILIEEAGLDTGLSSDQNNISKKIKEYDDKMESLRKTLEKERQRYWNQFTALEKTLSELNAQSSWLTDMMG